jgi:hypothetical protein
MELSESIPIPDEILYSILIFLPPELNWALVHSTFHQIFERELYWKESIHNCYHSTLDTAYLCNLYMELLFKMEQFSIVQEENEEMIMKRRVKHLKRLYLSLKYHPTKFNVEHSANDYIEFKGNGKNNGDYSVNSKCVNTVYQTCEYQAKRLCSVQIEFRQESTGLTPFLETCICSNLPVPICSKDNTYFLPVWYMEFTITDATGTSNCTVGLGVKSYPSNRQPGWDRGSVAYHGDDGGRFLSTPFHRSVIEKYGAGDTVGLGIYYPTQEVFVTKNGKFLEILCHLSELQFNMKVEQQALHLLMGFWDKLTVNVNFGTKPFLFHLDTALIELISVGNVFGQKYYGTASISDFNTDDSYMNESSEEDVQTWRVNINLLLQVLTGNNSNDESEDDYMVEYEGDEDYPL